MASKAPIEALIVTRWRCLKNRVGGSPWRGSSATDQGKGRSPLRDWENSEQVHFRSIYRSIDATVRFAWSFLSRAS